MVKSRVRSIQSKGYTEREEAYMVNCPKDWLVMGKKPHRSRTVLMHGGA